jgi:superfamily I DNA and/or RNA helicase
LQAIIVEGGPEKAKSIASKPSLLSPCFNMDSYQTEFDSWALNDSQKRTIVAALGRTLTLIQGPPGTGKTVRGDPKFDVEMYFPHQLIAQHTAVHLIKLLCLMFAKLPILACAYTNVATDNLLEGLRGQGVPAIRLGQPVKVRPELRDATLDHQLGLHSKSKELEAIRTELIQCNRKSASSSVSDSTNLQREAQGLRARLKALQNSMVSDIIKDAPVICCTCIGAGDDLLRDFYFPVVVMDGACCHAGHFRKYLKKLLPQSALRRASRLFWFRCRILALSKWS